MPSESGLPTSREGNVLGFMQASWRKPTEMKAGVSGGVGMDWYARGWAQTGLKRSVGWCSQESLALPRIGHHGETTWVPLSHWVTGPAAGSWDLALSLLSGWWVTGLYLVVLSWVLGESFAGNSIKGCHLVPLGPGYVLPHLWASAPCYKMKCPGVNDV